MECHEWIVRNEEVRRRAGIEREFVSQAYQRVLRWFGNVERMDEYHMTRSLLMAEASGTRYEVSMDGVKVDLSNSGMLTKAVRQFAIDRKEWKALVYM